MGSEMTFCALAPVLLWPQLIIKGFGDGNQSARLGLSGSALLAQGGPGESPGICFQGEVLK